MTSTGPHRHAGHEKDETLAMQVAQGRFVAKLRSFRGCLAAAERHGAYGDHIRRRSRRWILQDLVATGLPLPQGLMIKSPDASFADVQDGKAVGSRPAGERSKVLRGDKGANSWHADNITSALRWEARTRESDDGCR